MCNNKSIKSKLQSPDSSKMQYEGFLLNKINSIMFLHQDSWVKAVVWERKEKKTTHPDNKAKRTTEKHLFITLQLDVKLLLTS